MKKIIIIVAIVIAIGASAMGAGFTSEAAWRTAAGSWAMDTFEATAVGTQLYSIPALGISFDPLNDGLTYPSVQTPGSGVGGSTTSGTNILLNDIDFSLPARGPINLRPLTAGTYITAVGYWNTGGDDTTLLSFFDVSDSLIEQVECSLGTVFNGIVSTTAAYRVEIAPGSQGNGYFTLDDLQVSVVPVPVPGALVLGGIGMSLVGWLRRRRTL